MTRVIFSNLAARPASATRRLFRTVGRVVLMSALFVVVGYVSSSVASAQSQLQLNEEACAEYKKADADMNAAYQRIRREYRQNAQFIVALTKAQRAWVT